MDKRNIVVIGASAGGVSALQTLVARLPADFDAAVLVVMHIPVHTPTFLHAILDRAGPLPAKLAENGEPIVGGTIYVAPTDRHLVIENQQIRLTQGPRENRVRPCIDALFRSAALEFGTRVVGVVLTGMLDDGTSGLWSVKDRGGVTIIQSPDDAAYPAMPESALKHVSIDYIQPLAQIGDTLIRLCSEPVSVDAEKPPRELLKLETKIAIEGDALKQGVMDMGENSRNTCPECHGVMVKMREGSILRFRCHTGHAFSLKTLLVDVDKTIENTLWAAVRAIEERALLLREMEHLSRDKVDTPQTNALANEATAAEERAQVVRELIVAGDSEKPFV